MGEGKCEEYGKGEGESKGNGKDEGESKGKCEEDSEGKGEKEGEVEGKSSPIPPRYTLHLYATACSTFAGVTSKPKYWSRKKG